MACNCECFHRIEQMERDIAELRGMIAERQGDSGKDSRRRVGKMRRAGMVAAVALITEANFSAAAARAGISEATLCRWLRREDFQQLLNQARQDQGFYEISTSDSRESGLTIEACLLLMSDAVFHHRFYRTDCPLCGMADFRFRDEGGKVAFRCRNKCDQKRIELAVAERASGYRSASDNDSEAGNY